MRKVNSPVSTFRKVCAVRIEPPAGGMETVGDAIAAMACYGIVFGLAWLLVWPV